MFEEIIRLIKERSHTSIVVGNVMRESVLQQTLMYDTTTASDPEDKLSKVVLLNNVGPVARHTSCGGGLYSLLGLLVCSFLRLLKSCRLYIFGIDDGKTISTRLAVDRELHWIVTILSVLLSIQQYMYILKGL